MKRGPKGRPTLQGLLGGDPPLTLTIKSSARERASEREEDGDKAENAVKKTKECDTHTALCKTQCS